MKITYSGTIQPDNKAKVERYIDKWIWLLPKWALTLDVCLWNSDKNNSETAIMCAEYDYRRLTLEIFTQWLDLSDSEKESTIVHEFIHAFTLPPITFARTTFDLLSEPETPLNKLARQELNVRNESMTTDLAFAICEKFNDR